MLAVPNRFRSALIGLVFFRARFKNVKLSFFTDVLNEDKLFFRLQLVFLILHRPDDDDDVEFFGDLREATTMTHANMTRHVRKLYFEKNVT